MRTGDYWLFPKLCVCVLTKSGSFATWSLPWGTYLLAQGAVHDAEADVADQFFVRSTINMYDIEWYLQDAEAAFGL